jgi:hypothetical protein
MPLYPALLSFGVAGVPDTTGRALPGPGGPGAGGIRVDRRPPRRRRPS